MSKQSGCTLDYAADAIGHLRERIRISTLRSVRSSTPGDSSSRYVMSTG